MTERLNGGEQGEWAVSACFYSGGLKENFQLKLFLFGVTLSPFSVVKSERKSFLLKL